MSDGSARSPWARPDPPESHDAPRAWPAPAAPAAPSPAPASPPPPPPAYAYDAWTRPAYRTPLPPPPSPDSWRNGWTPVVLALLALIVGVLGVGVALDRESPTAAPAVSTPPPVPTTRFEPTPSVPPNPGPERQSGPSTTVTTLPDVDSIAAVVRESTVDITTSFGSGNRSAGTGMILTTTGAILTNYHVVASSTEISVQINGEGPSYAGKVVGTARAEDVAVIQLEDAANLRPIQVGNPNALTPGDTVVAVGNALGRSGPLTVASGTVTALNQTATAADPSTGASETLTGLIQSSTPLQPGDSGGPLVNTAGQVVGMNTAASLRNRTGSAGVAFSIPINRALSIANDIRAGRASSVVQIGQPGYLGVQVTREGAVVTRVVPGMPAEAAGLVAGDRIVAVNDSPVETSIGLTEALAAYRAGDTVNLQWVDAGGSRRTARVKLSAGES
jgi:S1-C subfamily serine protease